MTKIGRKSETEIVAALICIAASQGFAGRLCDALCIVVVFHITNLIFGIIKRFLNPAFQFPFLAVCVTTCSEAIYIISDRFEFPVTLMGPALLSGAILLLHLGPNTFFTERDKMWKHLKGIDWHVGILFILLIVSSTVINLTFHQSVSGTFAMQFVGTAFLIAVLNRLFQLAKRYNA